MAVEIDVMEEFNKATFNHVDTPVTQRTMDQIAFDTECAIRDRMIEAGMQPIGLKLDLVWEKDSGCIAIENIKITN